MTEVQGGATHHVTGFSNVEEDYSNQAAGVEVMPWRPRTRCANAAPTTSTRACSSRSPSATAGWSPGQQQYSARAVTRIVIDMLGV